MPVATEASVRAALDKGTPASVYLLVGDDEVGKSGLLEAFTSLVPEEDRAFNLHRFYADEAELGEVVAAARTLPFLGARRVVILLRGEAVLKARSRAAAEDGDERAEQDTRTEGAPDDTAELERYLQSPSPDGCLVIVAADVNRATRLGKALVRHAVVVEYWGFKGEREVRGRGVADALRQAQRHAAERLAEAGLRAGRDVVTALVEHAGTDIAVLRGDLERLVTYCDGKAVVSVADVRAVVSGAVSVDAWAVTGAIERGDAAAALRELHLAVEGGTSPFMVLGQLGWFVRAKLPNTAPARVRAAVEALFRTDAAMKSSGGDPQVLLERLVVELCGEAEGRRAGPARPLRRG
jgi:DNA polymerase III subunit delta